MDLTKSKYYFEALDYYTYNIADCLEALNYALSYDPEDADALTLMGRIYSEVLKDYEQALEYFAEAMMYDVNNINTPQYYISCLISNEDYMEAERLINFAIRIKGIDRFTILNLRSLLSEKRGSLKNALRFLRESEQLCFDECSLKLVKDRKKFLKAKISGRKLTGKDKIKR
ncbi:MAG: hypothetical protein K0M63_02140 [Weeksellaceae bacterium]|nr:hypothetical protein [Weeksellaceae bacterium]